MWDHRLKKCVLGRKFISVIMGTFFWGDISFKDSRL